MKTTVVKTTEELLALRDEDGVIHVKGFGHFIRYVEKSIGRSLTVEDKLIDGVNFWYDYSYRGYITKNRADIFARSIVDNAQLQEKRK